MNYRQLGNTGIQVSELGMGCWGIGSKAYGDTDDSTSREAILTAYDNGINFFDTADVYGAGHSEEILGDVLKPVRDKVVIATKVGSIPHVGREMPHILHPQHIRIACEASLMRLKTDYIDLYQLHSPPMNDIDMFNNALDTLELLQQEGKIRAIGVSSKSPNDAVDAYCNSLVSVLQINFNIIDQRAILESTIHWYCENNEVGLIARTPLAFGFLSGRYPVGTTFTPPDHRANWSQKQIDIWCNAHKLFAHLRPFDMNPARFALSFCISHPEVSTTITGMLTPQEVKDNLKIRPLDQDILKAIREIYQSNDFFITD